LAGLTGWGGILGLYLFDIDRYSLFIFKLPDIFFISHKEEEEEER